MHLVKNRLAVFASLCALFVLIVASREVLESCRYGLRLCVDLIVPSLFPFFVVTGLLNRLGFPFWLGEKLSPLSQRLFRVSGAGVGALLAGLCGGYPMGAACVAELLRNSVIDRREAERLLLFCNNTGPAFFVGAVGSGVFHSPAIGLTLYGIHALSAVLIGILFRAEKAMEPSTLPVQRAIPSFSKAFPGAVQQAVTSVLSVCGYVVCFSVFTGLLDTSGFFNTLLDAISGFLHLEPSVLRAAVIGFLELGSGIGALRGLPPSALSLALAAGIVGWGGISVQFQSLAMLADLDIKSAPLFAGRLLSAVLSFLLAYSVFLLKS